ncbi:peroxiredoxin [Candidatus Mancarchaeum acidiphilum]|uniref:Peroxiredoxin n=1 Tax=Candidatus Mancarchaeum acidiphilum TaxID=1920749 RepID=A0A218NMU5_9ARCH|nr:redoxin family protein [Candidatus Mancarchaeum acidiphilum]ASI13795.1 peroxiredoxin [Candidatus Mancarchaeum acidiphilum]
MKKVKTLYKLMAIVVIIAAAVLLYMYSAGTFSHKVSAEILSAGEKAPNESFTLLNGSTVNIGNYRGKPILVWLMTTWCSSCAQSTSTIANNMTFFKDHNVTVFEIENYEDLGQSGMAIGPFIDYYAHNSTGADMIKGGISSKGLTFTYNPKGYLDIYYLIAPNGTIYYINGSPVITMNDLKQEVTRLES